MKLKWVAFHGSENNLLVVKVGIPDIFLGSVNVDLE